MNTRRMSRDGGEYHRTAPDELAEVTDRCVPTGSRGGWARARGAVRRAVRVRSARGPLHHPTPRPPTGDPPVSANKSVRAAAVAAVLAAAAVASAVQKQKQEEKEYKSGIVWPEPKVVTPGEKPSDPPSDAVALFDGKD